MAYLDRSTYAKYLLWFGVVLVCLIIYGDLRLDHYRYRGKEMVKVAAVSTDSDVSNLPLPDDSVTSRYIQTLMRKTGIAAKAGAEIVVWNEAAFVIEKKDEERWVDSLKVLSKKEQIYLFASHVIVMSKTPFHYENKYYLINDNGDIIYKYLKHQPVPGEPAIKGKAPLTAFNIAGVKIGGAICYDYDFPYLSALYGDLGADIVALPSSDWRGIDPLHTEMAAFRAIEQGHSVIRSTRFGLSAMITPFGEYRGQMSSLDDNDKILISEVSKMGTTTIYSIVGDVVIYVSFAFILFFIWRSAKRKEPAEF